MGTYIDYLKLMWNSGATQGKDLKKDHKDKAMNKFKKLKK